MGRVHAPAARWPAVPYPPTEAPGREACFRSATAAAKPDPTWKGRRLNEQRVRRTAGRAGHVSRCEHRRSGHGDGEDQGEEWLAEPLHLASRVGVCSEEVRPWFCRRAVAYLWSGCECSAAASRGPAIRQVLHRTGDAQLLPSCRPAAFGKVRDEIRATVRSRSNSRLTLATKRMERSRNEASHGRNEAGQREKPR